MIITVLSVIILWLAILLWGYHQTIKEDQESIRQMDARIADLEAQLNYKSYPTVSKRK